MDRNKLQNSKAYFNVGRWYQSYKIKFNLGPKTQMLETFSFLKRTENNVNDLPAGAFGEIFVKENKFMFYVK